jgi:hypothetical protein
LTTQAGAKLARRSIGQAGSASRDPAIAMGELAATSDALSWHVRSADLRALDERAT